MKRIEVVAAIIRKGDRIFVTQRGYGPFKDKWEFPGGKMEPGESPEAALIREIHEELATEISIDRFVCTIEHEYPEFHLTMHNFLCNIVRGDLQLLEHEAARWLDIDHLNDVDWLPADLKILGPLQDILGKLSNMTDVRITAIRKADYRDLQAKYENPIEHSCDVTEGQVWISHGGQKPEGMCPEAWKSMKEFVEALARGESDFFDGWMKDPCSAMISCNDGFRPVSFYIESIS